MMSLSEYLTMESASQEAISDAFSSLFDECDPPISVEHGLPDFDRTLAGMLDVCDSWFDDFLGEFPW